MSHDCPGLPQETHRPGNPDAAGKKRITGHITRSRILGRLYGILVIVEGIVGLIAFGLVLQLWAYNTSLQRIEKYGPAYEQIYEVESTGFALLAILCLVVLFAGVGFLKRERWAVYCAHISGLLMFLMFGGVFLIRNFLWHDIEESYARNIPSLFMKLILVLIVSLPLIIPPLIPSIRDSTRPKRRREKERPYVG